MMIDFFRFAINTAHESDLLSMEKLDLKSALNTIQHPSINHSGIALFDPQVLSKKAHIQTMSDFNKNKDFSFYLMPDIRHEEVEQQIEQASQNNFKAIVFHPYLQKISTQDLTLVQRLAKLAEKNNLFICICCAYGSQDIYRYTPLHCVTAIAQVVQCPVIITHAGGAKITDALLIADAFPHILLDTSFSLHYWQESPLEEWFAYSIAKLGAQRWMFGSDAPFIPLEESLQSHHSFCKKHHLNQTQIDLLMGGTAANLLGLT